MDYNTERHIRYTKANISYSSIKRVEEETHTHDIWKDDMHSATKTEKYLNQRGKKVSSFLFKQLTDKDEATRKELLKTFLEKEPKLLKSKK